MLYETNPMAVAIAEVMPSGVLCNPNLEWKTRVAPQWTGEKLKLETLIHPTDLVRFRDALNTASITGSIQSLTVNLSSASADWKRYTLVLIPFGDRQSNANLNVMLLPFQDGSREIQSAPEQSFSIAPITPATNYRFLSKMSHEMRNRVNAVLGFTELIKKDPACAHQRFALDQIEAAGHALLETMTQVLQFSKLETGDTRLDQQEFELGPLLHHLEDCLQGVKRGAGVTIELGTIPRHPSRVIGDPLRVQQILSFFAFGLLKNKERGGIRLFTEVWDETEQSYMVRFSLQELAPSIEDGFFSRVQEWNNRPWMGEGKTDEMMFGLIMNFRLIERMQGTLRITDQETAFRTLAIDIPFAKLEDSRTKILEENTQPSVKALGRIVLAEDDPVNRTLTERILKTAGFDVLLAANGLEALTLVKQQAKTVSLVILDIDMPVMNGLTAAALIRRSPHSSRIPILALTGGILADELKQAMAAGFTDFITKPFQIGHLLQSLENSLGQPAPDEPGLNRLRQSRNSPFTHDRSEMASYLTMTEAIEACAKDLDFYRELLRTFRKEFYEAPQLLIALYQDQDLDRFLTLIRHLKGSSATLGAIEIADLTTRIHRIVSDRLTASDAQIEELIVDLVNRLRDLLQVIDRAIADSACLQTNPNDE